MRRPLGAGAAPRRSGGRSRARSCGSPEPPCKRRKPSDKVEAQPPLFRRVASDSNRLQAHEPSAKRAEYHRPFIAHASIGPACAIATFTQRDGSPHIEVWSHTQGPYILRRELARAFGLPVDQLTVHHVEGVGCYGHNPADDAAMDACLLARAVPGRPVQVVWSREDELGWAPYGPAAAHREGGEPIEAAPEIPLAMGGGGGRNAIPGYDFPARRIEHHQIRPMPLRTSSLRSLGAFLNVFAAESFIDELAEAAGRDPIEYRLAHLSDPRGRRVVETAAHRAGWGEWEPSETVGHGIGYARYKNTSAYCAVVAEVEAIEEVRVRRLTLAVDAGLVIAPSGAVNQLEGGAIQATSWTLKERVRFDRHTVTNTDWETYPILRFTEVPAVDVELTPDDGNPPLGVGEAAQGPTAAAIVNALYDVLGVRVRSLPLTQEQIIAAMPD